MMKLLKALLFSTALVLFFTNCSEQTSSPAKTSEYLDTSSQSKANSSGKNSAPPVAAADAIASVPVSSPNLTAGRGATSYEDFPAPSSSPIVAPNGWVSSGTDNLSTFAADVDTGSYALARATINNEGNPDPKDIRVEEFINYFPYNYKEPQDGEAFKVNMELGVSPFNNENKILRIGILGKTLNLEDRKPANLVFLVDVSGSMEGTGRLELAQQAMEVLVNSLEETDRIAIVTYASNTEVVLPSTPIKERSTIIDAIYGLNASGSTAMGDGIKLAYEQALQGMKENDVNSRVIILSDGDTNVGLTSHEEILSTIKEEVKNGIYLTTVGFGLGNYRDDMMEQLANNGNGNYYYVDSITEAKRVFQAEVTGVLEVIAKDLKIQVEFDPEQVSEYRLLGYENRDISDNDFRNDDVDAGELGAGHRITALYEVKMKDIIELNNFAKVRLRFKDPKNNDQISEIEENFDTANIFDSAINSSRDFRLALVVASFAEILRKSPHATNINLQDLQNELISFMEENNGIEQELLGLMQKVPQ